MHWFLISVAIEKKKKTPNPVLPQSPPLVSPISLLANLYHRPNLFFIREPPFVFFALWFGKESKDHLPTQSP